MHCVARSFLPLPCPRLPLQEVGHANFGATKKSKAFFEGSSRFHQLAEGEWPQFYLGRDMWRWPKGFYLLKQHGAIGYSAIQLRELSPATRSFLGG